MARSTAARKREAQEGLPGLNDILDGIMAAEGVKPRTETDRPSPTGIDVLDFYNGRYFVRPGIPEDMDPGDIPPDYYQMYVGVPRGKVIGLVGFTGTGKTTLAVQIGMSIVAPYEDGTCFHIDLERAWSVERTADITQQSVAAVKRKYKILPPLSVQKIYALVKKMINAKVKAAAENERLWTVDAGTGERIMVPTVLIIDPVASLQTDDTLDENDEMGSAMFEAGAQAKFNNILAQRLAGMIGSANITLIWLNHIRDKIQTGPTPAAKRIQHMGASESIPGGHGFPQVTDFMLKLTPAEALKSGEKMKIHGKIVKLVVVKTRLSYDGRVFHLVLTDTGFDNDWCNFHFLMSEKLVGGAAAGLFLTDSAGVQSRRFAQADFKRLFREDEEFRRIATDVLQRGLSALVPEPGSEAEAAVAREGRETAEAERPEIDADEALAGG